MSVKAFCVRKIAILGLAILGASVTANNAQAASIAFFRDAAFVEVGSLTDADDNMRSALVGLGHTVNDFTGTSEANWVAGLNGNNLIVIPEIFADLAGSMSPTAVIALQNALAQGAGLILGPGFGSGTPHAGNLLNLAFGTSLVEEASGESSVITSAATGTAFAGGPAALPNISDTDGLNIASFGAETVSIYDQTAFGAGSSSVALITPGSGGQGVYIGWGWRSGPDFPNAAWNGVLGSAVTEVASETAISISGSTTIPAPSVVALLGLGVAGLGLARRRRAA